MYIYVYVYIYTHLSSGSGGGGTSYERRQAMTWSCPCRATVSCLFMPCRPGALNIYKQKEIEVISMHA
jgi:hypothetical protein